MVPEAHSESTDEEEFDKREFGIFQCLPVAGRLPVDLDSMEIPDTVEEYLLRVRSVPRCLYAKPIRLAGVFFSHVDKSSFIFVLQARG